VVAIFGAMNGGRRSQHEDHRIVVAMEGGSAQDLGQGQLAGADQSVGPTALADWGTGRSAWAADGTETGGSYGL